MRISQEFDTLFSEFMKLRESEPVGMMKWFCVKMALLIMMGLAFAAPQLVYGEDNPAVEKRVQKLEEENQQLRDLVKQMQKRLDKLEGIQSPKAEASKENAPAEESKKKKKDKDKDQDKKAEEPAVTSATGTVSSQKIKATNDARGYVDGDRIDTPEKGKGPEWLPSLFGEQFRLGGRLQMEYFDTERETNLPSALTETPGGSFGVDELSLYVDGDFKNSIRFYSRVDFTGEDEGLVEGYVDFDDLPLNSRLRAGLQKRFFRPNRYTETYPLTGIAFWRSRVLGLTLKNEFDPVYTYLSVTNGANLEDRQLGEDESAKMLSEDNSEFDFNGDKELSAGLGLDMDFAQYGKLDVMGFGLTGQLSNDDVEYLQTDVPGYGFETNKDKELFGVNLDYGIDEWDFFAQAIAGRDGDIDRFSWYAELSYQFQFEGLKYLDSIRPLVRYGQLDIDTIPQPFMTNGSLTWDRQQWLFGVVTEMVRNVNFRIEYALNDEDTGDEDIHNNEILFQLEVSF